MLLSTPMIGIALYDYTSESVDLQRFFKLMEDIAEQIGIPWASIGITTSAKLIQFKNGKRKLEKTNFEGITEIELYGDVSEPGTNLDWKMYAVLPSKERYELCLCFEKRLIEETSLSLNVLVKDLLSCADFKYGIVYERLYNYMPHGYAGGALGSIGKSTLTNEDEKKIGAWMHQYGFADGDYKTGLLRDVYPYNIFVDTHLDQMVDGQTLRSWIETNKNHGRLEKLTSDHWIWSLDPDQIPHAQETLQEAGLLLCYKV